MNKNDKINWHIFSYCSFLILGHRKEKVFIEKIFLESSNRFVKKI